MPLVLASDCFCIRDGLDPCEVLWASFLGLEGSLASRASGGSDDDGVHLVRFVFSSSLSFILSVSLFFILSVSYMNSHAVPWVPVRFLEVTFGS